VTAPKPLRSGLPNTLALDFIPNHDIFAENKPIDRGYILPGGGFTVEAAFFTRDPTIYGAIVGKEGTPGGVTGTGGTGLSTFELKTAADNSHLRVQQYDAAGNLVSVDSALPLVAEQWYYTAVVNDGSQLSLWLDSGAGYELQGSVAIDGALYQGPEIFSDYNGDLKVDGADYVMLRNNPSSTPAQYDTWRSEFDKYKYDWWYNWCIGRTQFNGNPGDFLTVSSMKCGCRTQR